MGSGRLLPSYSSDLPPYSPLDAPPSPSPRGRKKRGPSNATSRSKAPSSPTVHVSGRNDYLHQAHEALWRLGREQAHPAGPSNVPHYPPRGNGQPEPMPSAYPSSLPPAYTSANMSSATYGHAETPMPGHPMYS